MLFVKRESEAPYRNQARRNEAFEQRNEATAGPLEWRKAQVLELSSQGYSEREIGSKLQISNITVHRDLMYLKKLAQDNLQKHIHEVVPEEYQKCMVGMKHNLKETLEIANTVTDPRVKLQARAIANDCYKFILDMSILYTLALNYGSDTNYSDKK